jgi:hypothetical protein
VIDPWQELFFKVALAANCLPSSFVDGNEHVFKAIEAARATADHSEQCALALDPLYKKPEPGRSKVSTGYDEGYNDALDEAQQAIRGLKTRSGDSVDAWLSVDDRLPEVKQNDTQEFIVACRRAFNGKTYVFSAEYANDFLLNGEEEQRTITGWFMAGEDNSGEYDTVYTSACNPGDVITHWQPLPAAPGAAIESQRSGNGEAS